MNKDFVIYNAAGEILRIGNCPEDAVELQVYEGEFLLEGSADCKLDSVDPQTATVIPNGRPLQALTAMPMAPAPSDTLPVATQLDLLWQAMDAGTFPKAEPFYSAIKAQKDAAA